MSEPYAPPLLPKQPHPLDPLSRPQTSLSPAPAPLYKQRSWSPDAYRDEAWMKRKGKSKDKRSKSVTEEDLDELKACIELGFGFDSPEVDLRLSQTLPALGLYYAVNKHYTDCLPKSTTSFSSFECESPSSQGSPSAIFGPGDNPQTVKTRLRQWAQVVACTVRECSWK